MGEAAILDFREVRDVLHFGLNMPPTRIFILKTLFDLVNHARARINSRDGDVSRNFRAKGREKSRDVSATAAADVDDAFGFREGEGGVGGC